MSHRNSLEFLTSLRGIAAIWVVFYHIKIHLVTYLPAPLIFFISKGYLAVDFFFILSGFIIAMSYQSKINLLDITTMGIFFKKRFARIYPLHLLMLILYLSIPLSYDFYNKVLPDSDTYSVDNFILSFFLLNNWGFNDNLSWNIPSWSISTEFAAYLAFPALTLFFKKENKLLFLIYVFSAAFLLKYIYDLYGEIGIGKNIPQLALVRCVVEFFVGMCVWNIYKINGLTSKYISILILVLSLIVMWFIFYGYINEVVFVPLVLSSFLLSMVIYNDHFKIKLLFLSGFIFLGDISYSIYLSHYFIKDIFKMAFLHEQPASITWVVGYFFTVMVFSTISYKYIEVVMRDKINNWKIIS